MKIVLLTLISISTIPATQSFCPASVADAGRKRAAPG